MNIIEAMQAAESGKHITNAFLKPLGQFLRYMGAGVFYAYEIDGKYTRYKYEVRSFDVARVLSISWEICDTKVNPNVDSTEVLPCGCIVGRDSCVKCNPVT